MASFITGSQKISSNADLEAALTQFAASFDTDTASKSWLEKKVKTGSLYKPDFKRTSQLKSSISSGRTPGIFSLWTKNQNYNARTFTWTCASTAENRLHGRGKLEYYEGSTYKGVIDLAFISSVRLSEVCDAPHDSHLVIDLVSHERHYTVHAESDLEMLRWVYAIRCAIKGIDMLYVAPFLGLTLAAIDEFVESVCGGESVLITNGTLGYIPNPAEPGKYMPDLTRRPELAMTTTNVNDFFQKPKTEAKKISYCDLLMEQGSSGVGEATVFISHAWKYDFIDVLKLLRYYFRDEPETKIFFDLFSNNQHENENPFEWWESTFMNAIKKMGRTVQILHPWDKPLTLTRVWCLYEIYACVKTGSLFDVAMTPEQRDVFINSLVANPEVYMQMLADIDLEKCEATRPEDKDKIFRVVRETKGGFVELNNIVSGKIREWVMSTIDDVITNRSPADTTPREQMWKLLRTNGILLMKSGKFSEARKTFETCVKEYQDIACVGGNPASLKLMYVTYADLGMACYQLGEFLLAHEHSSRALQIFLNPEVGADPEKCCNIYSNIALADKALGRLESALAGFAKVMEIILNVPQKDTHMLNMLTANNYNNMANVYLKQCNYPLSLEYFNKALEVYLPDTALGPNHLTVGVMYNNIGQVYSGMCQYAEALDFHSKSLKIRLHSLDSNHPDIGTSYNNIGSCLLHQGKHSEAIELYQKSLAIKLPTLGPEHISVGTTYSNIAVCYKAQRKYPQGLEYNMKCLTIRLKCLGTDHADVGTTYNNIAIIYNQQKNPSKAAEMHEKALKIRLKALGRKHQHVGDSYHNYASALFGERKFKLAADAFQEAVSIREQVLGVGHLQTKQSRDSLNICIPLINRG